MAPTLVVAVVIGVLGGRWLNRNTGTHRIAARLDELRGQVTVWQTAHDQRMRALERQVAEIEMSVATAGEAARLASLQIRKIRGHLLRRLEHVEQQREIELLVAQGRIPDDHLWEPGD